MFNKLPVFITGNQNKADYLSRQLGVELDHQKIDLLELQSTDLHEIVAHKLKQAYETVQNPYSLKMSASSSKPSVTCLARTLNGSSITPAT